MPAWLLTVFATAGKAAVAAVLSTLASFVTEKRIRAYVFVYGSRYAASLWPTSQWIQKVAKDIEADWEKEYGEDI